VGESAQHYVVDARIAFSFLKTRSFLKAFNSRNRLVNITKVISIAAFALVGASVFAQTTTPIVTDRQQNQTERIQQGVTSGELTKKEAATLRTEQRAIRAEKKAFKADGKVTAAERTQLRRDQNQASKRIYKKKHNAKKA
jgi:Ni/Co efflux regulator RcnB